MDLARAFLATARDDLRAAEALFEEGLWAASCFFSQQAAEKAAKAWLYGTGVAPPRTHYVSAVLSRVLRGRAAGSGERELVELLDDLEEYVTDARYPDRDGLGGYVSPYQRLGRRRAEEAKALAGQAVRFAERNLDAR